MKICNNCAVEVPGKYCSNCGQPAELKRIDAHYIRHEMEHLLHLEKGFLYTVKELLLRPGFRTREFLSQSRNRLIKPVVFVIVASLIYSVVNTLFHVEDQYVNYSGKEVTATANIMVWIQNHYGYANIIMGVFIALFIKIFFRKRPYNIYEILILLCFIMGVGMLIFTLFAAVQGIFHFNTLLFASLVGIIYMTWAIADFYGKKSFRNYLKAFAAYILGSSAFYGTAFLIGSIIDSLK